MISTTIKFRPMILSGQSRLLSTSQNLYFKFKLTDEAIKEFEEGEAKKPKKPVPEPALYTKESSLIMGRISSERYKKVVKVGIPKARLNEFLLLFVREQDSVHALDEKEECNPGDWVLLRRQPKPLDEGVEHKIEKVVYQYGNYIDPLTKRRSFGLYYDDDYQKLEKIKLDF